MMAIVSIVTDADECLQHNGSAHSFILEALMIVTKFGGSSLADASHFLMVRDILDMEPERRYIIVSAPGKRAPHDQKITDLLLACHAQAAQHLPYEPLFDQVAERYQEIARDLGQPDALQHDLDQVKETIGKGASRSFVASRGEYLCARLFALWMKLPFVDATDLMVFDEDGKLNQARTLRQVRAVLSDTFTAVIPGFYGADSRGDIHTFSRGGSDVTGALVAAALDADLYENWTDVTGFRSADPRIIPDASYISSLTYRELRELSYMGASVIHEEAVFPVRNAGIPTSIRNTINPHHPGTLIVPCLRQIGKLPAVTGIAGKRGFTTIILEKMNMNDEVGFGRKVLSVLETHRINFEHLPTGIDALCIMVNSESLNSKKAQVLEEIESAVHPDAISIQEGIALVACVGTGLFKLHGTIARLFTAVAEQGITIRTMFQAPSELSIIIGVDEQHLETAIQAIYNAFIRE